MIFELTEIGMCSVLGIGIIIGSLITYHILK